MKNSQAILDFSDFVKNFLSSSKAKRLFKNSKDDRKVKDILKNSQLLSEVNAALAKEIEFLVDNTIDKNTFLKRYEELEQKFEAKLARLTSEHNN